MIPVGSRVTIALRHPDRYTTRLQELLPGRPGTVEEIGRSGDFLVRFDEAVEANPPPWSPFAAFWFPAEDLAVDTQLALAGVP